MNKYAYSLIIVLMDKKANIDKMNDFFLFLPVSGIVFFFMILEQKYFIIEKYIRFREGLFLMSLITCR